MQPCLLAIHSIERLVAKLTTGRATGRDLVALASSLSVVPPIKMQLATVCAPLLRELEENLDALEDVTSMILGTLVDSPPLTIKEGGLVRDGFSAELDELREIAGSGKQAMAQFQAAEGEKTGITGLRIGYNSVFGYFLEVPRGQIDRVPDTYIRKQTIKACERYITPELKEFETKVLKAEELSRDLEYDLFGKLRDAVASQIGRILDTARGLATLDVLSGLAEVASEMRYCPPTISSDDTLQITEGRHPVIEQSSACEAFVPNDSTLDAAKDSSRRIAILTGPNMAGKSTYIRQTALIALLAQVGSWVPAQAAHVGVTDRIFTRVGSGDDISRGASTFMVEMIEIANILNNATAKSLVILDEVGRGTSTYDGLALAWSLVEHMHEKIGARTLFATHYHQLTALSETFGDVCNLNVAVRETGEEITFLHRIVEGSTDRSYGIHVARLAGVPSEVLTRAEEILVDLEAETSTHERGAIAPLETKTAQAMPHGTPEAPSQTDELLRTLDVNAMTPIEALLKLQELRGLAEGH